MSKRTSAAGREAWEQARKRHRLSQAHVQMARELGLNPNKLGSLDNHRQEPWKAPLPEFIEHLYVKRFGRERPSPHPGPERAGQPADGEPASNRRRPSP